MKITIMVYMVTIYIFIVITLLMTNQNTVQKQQANFIKSYKMIKIYYIAFIMIIEYYILMLMAILWMDLQNFFLLVITFYYILMEIKQLLRKITKRKFGIFHDIMMMLQAKIQKKCKSVWRFQKFPLHIS